jgi:hypothetical protein
MRRAHFRANPFNGFDREHFRMPPRHDDDVNLISSRSMPRHHAAAAKDFIIRVRGNH